jgi:hypothetical protein
MSIWRRIVLTVAQRPAFRNMWKIDRTKILHDRFCESMDTVLAKAEKGGSMDHLPPY